MRPLSLVLLALAVALPALGASHRISFERVLPAPHDLGKAEEVGVVGAIGDDPRIEAFLEHLIDQTNRSRTIRMRDIRFSTGPADAHLDIRNFTCSTTQREGEASSRDADGKRVKHRAFAVDAICTARIAVLSRTMKPLSTFEVKGQGSSPRRERITEEERRAAIEAAARHAAAEASELITPRRIRESIQLEEGAPELDPALPLLESGRYEAARKLWETAARQHPRSAALQFNLAAVCEALGDRKAAERHYLAAREMAPQEPRYASEWRAFQSRGELRIGN